MNLIKLLITMDMTLNPCDNPYILRIIYFIKELITLVYFAIPIGLILMVMLDLAKNVMAKDNDAMKKNVSIAIKRVMFAVVMFLVYTLVSFTTVILEDSLTVKKDETEDKEKMKLTDWINCYIDVDKDTIKAAQDEYDKNKKAETFEDVEKPDFNNSIIYTPVGENNTEILKVAETLWKKIASGNYTYDGKNGKNVPITGTTIDCSSFISWILYEYGYQDKFGGGQHSTLTFYQTNWTELGWTEIAVAAGEDVTSKLQPGDILVRDYGNGDGHINITVSVENGVVMTYDCGGVNNWKNSGGNPVDKTNFAKLDHRPGKIIRVAKKEN